MMWARLQPTWSGRRWLERSLGDTDCSLSHARCRPSQSAFCIRCSPGSSESRTLPSRVARPRRHRGPTRTGSLVHHDASACDAQTECSALASSDLQPPCLTRTQTQARRALAIQASRTLRSGLHVRVTRSTLPFAFGTPPNEFLGMPRAVTRAGYWGGVIRG